MKRIELNFKDLLSDEEVISANPPRFGLIRIHINYPVLFQKFPKIAKWMIFSFFQFKRELIKNIVSPKKECYLLEVLITKPPFLSLDIGNSLIIKDIIKRRSGKLISFDKIVIVFKEDPNNYKYQINYRKQCGCVGSVEFKRKTRTLDKTLHQYSGPVDNIDIIDKVPLCKKCSLKYIEVPDETIYKRYQRCKFITLGSSTSENKIQTIYLDDWQIDTIHSGAVYKVITNLELMMKFSKDNFKMKGAIQFIYVLVQFQQISHFLIHKPFYDVLSLYSQNNLYFNKGELTNKKEAIYLFRSEIRLFYQRIISQNSLSNLLPIKVTLSMIMLILSKLILEKEGAEELGSKVKKLSKEKSKKEISAKKLNTPISLLIYSDDSDFIINQLNKSFNTDSQLITVLPSCDTFDQFASFCIANCQKIIIIKNPQTHSTSFLDKLKILFRDGILNFLTKQLNLQFCFIIVIDRGSVRFSRKQKNKNKNREFEENLFFHVDHILDFEILNNILISVDLSSDNNEFTFRQKWNVENTIIDQWIFGLKKKRSENNSNTQNKIPKCQEKSYSILSQITSIFTSITIQADDKSISLPMGSTSKGEECLKLQPKLIEKQFLWSSNKCFCLKSELKRFERLLKTVSAFKVYFSKIQNLKEPNLIFEAFTLTDYFIAFWIFEETNLLLGGPESVSMGNKFPFLSFYLQIFNETNDSEDLEKLVDYSCCLFEEITS